MKQSLLFVPTLRENPKDTEITSHKILVKGGYIKQVAAGVYVYLPLALRLLSKIEKIIREELNSIGCSELLMSCLQPKDLWVESGRFESFGKEMMRLYDRHERVFCLGPTHEEIITYCVREYANSYKKLPLALYQIQTKFRDEFRPRYGLMRCREFIMKDLYTFHTSVDDLNLWYDKVRNAYINILNRLELDYRIVKANSGAIGGDKSEEFMVLSEVGEDTICFGDEFAANVEVVDYPDGSVAPDGKGIIKHAKGIEVGHIFNLGTKYSIPMKAYYVDQDQVKKPIIMGCYGMGVSRLLMAVIEQHYVNDIMSWPIEISPFEYHIIVLDEEYKNLGFKIYDYLKTKYEVLIDDRDERAGVKFNDADLIGIKKRIIIGKKAKDDIVEFSESNIKSDINIKDIYKM